MIAFLPPWTGCCKASMKAVTPRQGRISYRVRHGTLIIDLKEMYRIISSAPRRGGIVRARSILNHQVPANPSGHRPGTTKWSDPARYLGRLAVRVRARMPVIGLMTAVPMTQLIVDREQAYSQYNGDAQGRGEFLRGGRLCRGGETVFQPRRPYDLQCQ